MEHQEKCDFDSLMDRIVECEECHKEFAYCENDKIEDDYPEIIQGQYTIVSSYIVYCPFCDCCNRLWKQ